MASPAPGQHSHDGAWWWSGSRWMPAWSDDRQWWFNGSTWVRVSPPRTFPVPRAIEWAMAAIWTSLWVIAVVWCVEVETSTRSGDVMRVGVQRSGLALGLASVALMTACGYLLGRAQRWTYVCALAGYVWVLLLALYVVVILAAPSPGASDNDTTAGAGLVILALPLLLVVSAFVGIGAGAGRLGGRRRSLLLHSPVR